MRKLKLNRERKRLQKRLDRTEKNLTEHRGEALTEIVHSEVATEYQRARAEKLLKRLDNRFAAKIVNDKHLDELLAAYEQKRQVSATTNPTPDPTPAQPEATQPKPILVAPKPEVDPEAKAKRIKQLEVEVRRIDWERSEFSKNRFVIPHEKWEKDQAFLDEYYALTAEPKEEPVLSPEEAEQIRHQKMLEAAQEKLNEQIKAENMRAAGEWPTRADIKFRLNLTVDQPPSAPRMADGSLQLYGTEKVPKGWEDRYQ